MLRMRMEVVNKRFYVILCVRSLSIHALVSALSRFLCTVHRVCAPPPHVADYVPAPLLRPQLLYNSAIPRNR